MYSRTALLTSGLSPWIAIFLSHLICYLISLIRLHYSTSSAQLMHRTHWYIYCSFSNLRALYTHIHTRLFRLSNLDTIYTYRLTESVNIINTKHSYNQRCMTTQLGLCVFRPSAPKALTSSSLNNLLLLQYSL